jgi:hypothetical protein
MPWPQPCPLKRKSAPVPVFAATQELAQTGGRSRPAVGDAAAGPAARRATAKASESARTGIRIDGEASKVMCCKSDFGASG